MLKRYIFLLSVFLVIGFNLNGYTQINDNPDAFIVIPNAYTSTGGTGVFNGPLATPQRTYQWLINANQLTSFVGTYITAFSMRMPASSTADWPTSDVTFTNFDIYLAPGVPPSQRHINFDSNIVGTKTQVRTGSLLIPAGSYRYQGNPCPFGPPVNFNTSYLYTGGHLLIELRHSGFTGTSKSNDAVLTSTSGYLTDFSSCWTGSYTGTEGGQANFCIIQLTNSPTPVGVSSATGLPVEFTLSQNYPNPFNPVTRIEYAIPSDSRVTLSVYDMLGKEVANLVNNNFQKAGLYSIEFNASNLTSGVYFYTITAQGREKNIVQTKKMILMK